MSNKEQEEKDEMRKNEDGPEEGEAVVKEDEQRAEDKLSYEDLQERCSQLEVKNEEMKDKYLRLFAEFDNYKKRAAKERMEMIKLAGEDIVKDLLPVIDDFERALKQVGDSKDMQSVKEGMQLIYHKLLRNLESKGVKQMNALEQDFNADYHEAVTEIPAPSDKLKGKVIDELEKGYYLNDRIIRYAKVVVGK